MKLGSGSSTPSSKYSLQLVRNSQPRLQPRPFADYLNLNAAKPARPLLKIPSADAEQWKVVKTKGGLRFQLRKDARHAASQEAGWAGWRKAPAEESKVPAKLPEIVHSARQHHNYSLDRQLNKVFTKQDFGATAPLRRFKRSLSPTLHREEDSTKQILSVAKQKITSEDGGSSLRLDQSKKMLSQLLQSYDPGYRALLTRVSEESERNANMYERAPARHHAPSPKRKSSKALNSVVRAGNLSPQKFKALQQAFQRRVEALSGEKRSSKSVIGLQKSVEAHKQEISKLVGKAIGQAAERQNFTLVDGPRQKLEILTLQLRKQHRAEERDATHQSEVVKKESTRNFEAMMQKHRSEMNERKLRDGVKRKRWMIAQEILNVLLALRSMKISPQVALEKKVFPKSPFEHKNAYGFIKSVKRGDLEEVRRYLEEERYLVHDFDYVHQTGAHWAAKRNNLGVLRVLLEHGANPNVQDMGGRTPLFLASKLGCLQSVKLLLAYKAKPNIKAHSGESSLDVAYNYKVKSFLMKARSLHIFLQFAPKEDRLKAWQQEGLKFFEEESLDELSEFVR